MPSTHRVLLVEHLDAVGAAAADARQHAAALRAAGFEVEGLVLEGDRGGELLFDTDQRTGTGFDTIGRGQLPALAARVRASRANTVLWAGATPGGGAAARALGVGVPALWWPTGFSPAGATAGPLAPLDPALAPFGGSAFAGEAQVRRRLSLWDGPFALVLALPDARASAALIESFAEAADTADDVDLVVLAHPEARFEQMARRAGVGQRVHFVGSAPREAEQAWLATAVVALVGGDAPVSGGLLLRALDSGCPLLPVGEAAAPVARWLDAHALAWPGGGLSERLGAALRREGAVLEARERGRGVAAAHSLNALAGRLGSALRASGARERRAA